VPLNLGVLAWLFDKFTARELWVISCVRLGWALAVLSLVGLGFGGLGVGT